ncbi:zinc finger and SCAN domain-containing protein 12-like [Aphis gossypii]|uniref:zinc finger and SCAN domain-containing protein 12-like n=1 Tax=Aphis gossypii TaxID=80765 RepID=UPI0021596E8C|nr:zinc finger and SCAN domain-containing protein 12-like [Aphis gossypii]
MTVDPPETTVNVPASLETKVETVADYETETSNSSEDNTDDTNGPDPLENSDENSASMKSTESNEDDVSFKYHCAKCNLSFKFNCWYQRHMLIHKYGTFACQYCPKLYKRKDILKEHQYLHFGGPKHKCNDCGKEFGDKRNLNTHVKLKHEESLIKCPKCEKMYSGKRQLRYHDNRVHSLKKPYKCNKCKEAFPVPCLLSTHRIKMNHCDTLND